MPWRKPVNEEYVTIGRSLVKSDASGCGWYEVRRNKDKDGKYLVACSPDGLGNWNYYEVEVADERAIKIDSNSITPPTVK